MLVALSSTPDQPSYTPSCAGHLTEEPMHASDPTVIECSKMMNVPIALPSSISSSTADGHDDVSEASSGTPTLSATTSASPVGDLHRGQVVHEQVQIIPVAGTMSSPHSPARLPAPTDPTPTCPPVPTASTHPSFTCRVDNSGTNLHVDLPTIKLHLGADHGYPPVRRGHTLECRWVGCVCKLKCKDRERAVHGIHKEDVAKHIWEHHLNFQDPCPKCGEIRWVHGFSKRRHGRVCVGRQPARCRTCYELYPSEVVLGAHYELRLCSKRMPNRLSHCKAFIHGIEGHTSSRC
jgi:hypothetical protein